MSFLVKILRPRSLNVNCYWHGASLQSRTESSKPAEVQEQIMITQITEESDETDEEREAKIERMRNKSRLAEAHRNMVHGKLPYPESKAFYHDSVQYKRRMWARYGEEQSKVYPGIAWPDKEELEDRKEYESVLCPLSIQEMVAIERNKIEEKEKFLSQRYKSIVEKISNNDKLIAEYHKKQSKKREEAEASKQEKEKLFSEIRQHFGFNIDPKDEKFQEMIEIKKKEEQKKKRLEKKKQREERLISMAMELEKTGAESGNTPPKEKGEVKEDSKESSDKGNKQTKVESKKKNEE